MKEFKNEDVRKKLNKLYIIAFQAWFFRIFCGYWMYVFLTKVYENIDELDSSLLIIGLVFTSISLLTFFMTRTLLEDMNNNRIILQSQLNKIEKQVL